MTMPPAQASTPPPTRQGRAKPMSVDDRRAAIAAATVPLLSQYGRDVTTRQIAEAAGVAEGTLFRVFDNKEAIIDAAVEVFLDPEPFREALRRIDPGLPLDLKMRLVIDRFQDRFSGIFGVFAALGARPRPPQSIDPGAIVAIFEHLLAPELERLRVPPADVFAFVRIIAFSSAMPQFAQTTGLDSDRLADLIVHGIIGRRDTAAEASAAPADHPATRTAAPRGTEPCC
ncbi:TetR/AcrR family transcriptional regulator [Agromyces sp. S2-1-8]|uniref:TetR/AcrR family transcriptional regulator n=1 Tax=unclassified Agromyces TaxID=2639701 RepID=UPI001E3C6F95|nr:TetR/AcrR family transcriptional regulator [Agromyces sp. S2-1-8]MCD5346586.1 TetR/AcrR family transcriptional regulator [Agromyces sp. S2-1-8]